MKERTKADEVIWYGGKILATVPITVSSKRVVKLMQEDYIELHFTLAEAIYFPVGAYCDDELFGRFYITAEQFPKYETSTGGYSYELKMEAWYRTWKQKLFMLTAVSVERGTEFRKEADWTLTQTLKEQMREVMVNLQLCGYVGTGEKFREGDDALDRYVDIRTNDIQSYAQSLSMSYSSVDILTALNNLADTWTCEWWVTGTEEAFVIHFGRCIAGTTVTLSLGDNIETIDASDDTSEKGRKLYVFGGEENIPNTYRKELKLTMTNCHGVDSFDAAYNGETLPFAATKDEKGNITDGLLPYGSEAHIRLKDNHGISQRFEVKVSEDNETRLYSEFYKRFPDTTSPLTLLDGYRITAVALLSKDGASERVQFLTEEDSERYAALREGGYTTTALRVVCEVCKKQYSGDEWKTVDWQEYPLTHKEWYEVTKHSPAINFLEADGHGAYFAYGDFTLRDGNYSWRVAMPEKNSSTNTYEGKKSAYITTQETPANVPSYPSLQEMVTTLDYQLSVPTEDNVRHTADITVYAETKNGEDYYTDLPLTELESEKDYFTRYRVIIHGAGLTLYEWQQYALASGGLLAWQENSGTFLLDPNGSGEKITLAYAEDGLRGVWLNVSDGWHAFTDEVEKLGKTAWSVDMVFFTKFGNYKYRYYTTPAWELDLQDGYKAGLMDNTYKSIKVSANHLYDIITLNGCGEIVRNTFSEVAATAPKQKPRVSVSIRQVDGASYARLSLTVELGLQKTRSTDFLRRDGLTETPVLVYKGTSVARMQMPGTSTVFELDIPEAEAAADDAFRAYGACAPALFLRCEVEYYDADDKRIELDGNITGDGYIKVLADTEDNPTFKLVWSYASNLLRAKVFNLDSQSNGRAFFLYDQNAGLDDTVIYNGAEFVLESDEDYMVPYKYYTSAIDDPSSVYSIGSQRLQLPRYREEEFDLYKERYRLSLVNDRAGNTWITRGGWAYRDGMIVPLANIDDPDSRELQELCVTKNEIYPTAKLLVASVRSEDKQEKEEVEGESKADAVTWAWKQYHVTLMQPNGDPITFKQSYIRKNSDKLKLRFLIPEDVKEWADNDTLCCDYEEIKKGCLLAGMTFEDEFNDKIGDYEQDHAIARNDEYGAKLPNDTMYPKKYDPVTLVNIDVRTLTGMKVVAAAEYTLLDYAFEYAEALNEGNFTFECGMMSDFLSSAYILGQSVAITHDALSKPKRTRVIGYEMKLDIPFDSPTLTCGESDAYSRLKQLEKGIRNLTEKKIVNNYYSGSGNVPDYSGIYEMDIDTGGDTLIGNGEKKVITCYVVNGLREDVTDNVRTWDVTRDSGNEAADAGWYYDHRGTFNGTLTITLDDLNGNNKVTFTVTATMNDDEAVTAQIGII